MIKSYDLVVALTNGGPGTASEMPAKFVMDNLFERQNIGLATAASTVMLVTVVSPARALALRAVFPRRAEAGMTPRDPQRHLPRARAAPARRQLTPGRVGLYAFLVVAAAVLPRCPRSSWSSPRSRRWTRSGRARSSLCRARSTSTAWVTAWSSACTGLDCDGISVGFWNSVDHPRAERDPVDRPRRRHRLCAVASGASGARTFSSPCSSCGAFIPYQVFIYPLVRIFSPSGIYNSLACIVIIHVIFGLPVMTLLFRNYYAGLPIELFKAARVDGAGFWQIFLHVMLPMSAPIIVVAAILQVTGIWNDFILGLVFAGRANLPMTVQLNNVVNSTTGERLYNVNMAATILTAAVPLLVYFVSGRWFVRGIAAGAIKG